jgi:phytoene dehydrogenase-like protein
VDYEQEFRELFSLKRIPSDPTVYVYISSKYHPADAPPGSSNLFVMINTPYDDGRITDEEILRAKETVLEKVGIMAGEDIRHLIRFEEVLTPGTIEKMTNSRWGSIYGVSSNSRNAAFLRQANRASSFRNLYFCGGSAHPGGGIPLVVQSGIIAAEKVIEDAARGRR